MAITIAPHRQQTSRQSLPYLGMIKAGRTQISIIPTGSIIPSATTAIPTHPTSSTIDKTPATPTFTGMSATASSILSTFPRHLHSFPGNTSSPLPQGQQLLDDFGSPLTEPPVFHSLPQQSNSPGFSHHQLAAPVMLGQSMVPGTSAPGDTKANPASLA